MKPAPPEIRAITDQEPDEIPPYTRVLIAANRVRTITRLLVYTTWATIGMLAGFGLSFLPWPVWAAVGGAMAVWFVVGTMTRNSARVTQMEIVRENEKSIRIVPDPEPEERKSA